MFFGELFLGQLMDPALILRGSCGRKNHLTSPRYLFMLGNVEQGIMENTNNAARDLFPGALEMMILDSLRRQPAHGYALVQHIQQRSNNLLQVEEGSLYPALQRLLKEKLVKAEWTVSSATNRRVRVYQITETGLRRLEREISSFDRMLEGIQMVLGPTRGTANS
jgi:transcriptional regulator